MDDTTAAADAASGCDDDEPQPQKESTATITSGCDASSPPSTSNPNPSPDSSLLSTLDQDYYSSYFNDDYMQGIEISKPPYVGDMEPLSALVAEYQSGSPILHSKAKWIAENFAAFRRTRGDGNCFYRCFMFSYLEHILVKQDKAEVDRVLVKIEQSKENLRSLGYAEFTYEDFFALFIELLESCLPGTETSIKDLKELLEKARDQMISDCAVMFLKFIVSSEMQTHVEFFQPFLGHGDRTVVQYCKMSVEPMGEECENVTLTALSNALGVPIRVVYLDNSDTGINSTNPIPNAACFTGTENDGSDIIGATNGSTDPSMQDKPNPVVTLLYRPGHYDILYPI